MAISGSGGPPGTGGGKSSPSKSGGSPGAGGSKSSPSKSGGPSGAGGSSDVSKNSSPAESRDVSGNGFSEGSSPTPSDTDSLDIDPSETRSDPEASKGLVDEQASIAEDVIGGDDSSEESPFEAMENEESASESVGEGENSVEESENSDASTPPENVESTVEANQQAVDLSIEKASNNLATADDALEAVVADIAAKGGAAVEPNIAPQALDVVSTPLPSGGVMTVQTFTDASGNYSGTFNTITDEQGQIEERSYESTSSVDVPTGKQGLSRDGAGNEVQIEEVTTDTTRQNVREVRQSDGSYLSSGTYSTQLDRPGDIPGQTVRETLSQEFGTSQAHWEVATLDADGKVVSSEVNQTLESREQLEAPSLGGDGPITQTESSTPLPDGTQRTETQITDSVLGIKMTQSVLSGSTGAPISRTSQIETPQLKDQASGWEIMEKLGISSGATLMRDNIEGGPSTYSSTQVTTEGFDAQGRPSVVDTHQNHTWSRTDGTAELTMIDHGSGPAEYSLTKTADGKVSTQSFLEGTEDTVVTHDYVDENGFAVTEVDAELQDFASAMNQNGQSSLETRSEVTRMKDQATLEDLRANLGSVYEELVETDPAFADLVEHLEGQKFAFVDQQTSSALKETSDSTPVTTEAHTMAFGANGVNISFQPGVNGAASQVSLSSAATGNSVVLGGGLDLKGGLAQLQTSTAGLHSTNPAQAMVDGAASMKDLSRGGRAVTGFTDSRPLGAAALAANTLGIVQAASVGDWNATLNSSGAALDGLSDVATGKLGSFAKLSGGLATVAAGAHDFATKGNLGGLFDVASGLGQTVAAAAPMVMKTGAAAVGTAGSLLASVAALAGITYGTAHSQRLAPQRI